MNIEVMDFSGPLDLLLHLIKTNKMNIYDINIEVITKEYIDYINNNRHLTIDLCSEYLVMASELIHLKSKLLLNNKDDSEDSVYEINSEDELKERLLEYEKIKNMAEDFRVLEEKRSHVYTKVPCNLNDYRVTKEVNLDISLSDLLNAFELFLNRQKLKEPLLATVTKREYSVEERCEEVRSIVKKRGKVNFFDLFEDISKSYVVVTFLSILDLAKKKEIVITQQNNFSEIFIEGSTR